MNLLDSLSTLNLFNENQDILFDVVNKLQFYFEFLLNFFPSLFNLRVSKRKNSEFDVENTCFDINIEINVMNICNVHVIKIDCIHREILEG